MVRESMMKRVSYNTEFKPDMKKFEENIIVDKRLEKFSKNKSQRFSAALRILIKNYNAKFKAVVLDKVKLASDEIAEEEKRL